jgi:hypothetical protein
MGIRTNRRRRLFGIECLEERSMFSADVDFELPLLNSFINGGAKRIDQLRTEFSLVLTCVSNPADGALEAEGESASDTPNLVAVPNNNLQRLELVVVRNGVYLRLDIDPIVNIKSVAPSNLSPVSLPPIGSPHNPSTTGSSSGVSIVTEVPTNPSLAPQKVAPPRTLESNSNANLTAGVQPTIVYSKNGLNGSILGTDTNLRLSSYPVDVNRQEVLRAFELRPSSLASTASQNGSLVQDLSRTDGLAVSDSLRSTSASYRAIPSNSSSYGYPNATLRRDSVASIDHHANTPTSSRASADSVAPYDFNSVDLAVSQLIEELDGVRDSAVSVLQDSQMHMISIPIGIGMVAMELIRRKVRDSSKVLSQILERHRVLRMFPEFLGASGKSTQ